ncbi:MAG: hypothetical protein HC854_16370 [Flavobacterium sp.]|nr:hypothetical protein [Flavobacterium sp.]
MKRIVIKERILFLIDENSNEAYENDLKLKQNIVGFENGFKYEITADFKFDSRVTFDLTNYSTRNFSKNYALLNSDNSLNYDLDKLGLFSIAHSFNNSLPSVSSFIDNYQLVSYRSFSKGINNNDIPVLKNNSFSLSHNYQGNITRFSTSTSLSYTKSEKIKTQESTITNNFVFSNVAFVNGGDSYRFDFKILNYFRKLKLATKLETQQTYINSPVKVNSTEFNTINTLLSKYVFSGTTYLEKPYNFDFTITQNRSYTTFNATKTTNVITKANAAVNYKFSETFIAELKSDFYWLDQNYSFLNTVFNYTPKKSRFSYRMVLNNLFNENEFKITSLNEFTLNTTSIPLIERYALLTVKYRF